MTKHEKMLDVAKKQIEFLSLWFNTQKSISSKEEIREIQAEMAKNLEIIKERSLQPMLDQQAQVYIPWKQRGMVRKLFLLYNPLNLGTSILHGVYYICWSILIFMILASIQHGFSVDAEFPRVMNYIVSLLSIFWPLLPVMIVVYFAAISREKTDEKKKYPLKNNAPNTGSSRTAAPPLVTAAPSRNGRVVK